MPTVRHRRYRRRYRQPAGCPTRFLLRPKWLDVHRADRAARGGDGQPRLLAAAPARRAPDVQRLGPRPRSAEPVVETSPQVGARPAPSPTTSSGAPVRVTGDVPRRRAGARRQPLAGRHRRPQRRHAAALDGRVAAARQPRVRAGHGRGPAAAGGHRRGDRAAPRLRGAAARRADRRRRPTATTRWSSSGSTSIGSRRSCPATGPARRRSTCATSTPPQGDLPAPGPRPGAQRGTAPLLRRPVVHLQHLRDRRMVLRVRRSFRRVEPATKAVSAAAGERRRPTPRQPPSKRPRHRTEHRPHRRRRRAPPRCRRAGTPRCRSAGSAKNASKNVPISSGVIRSTAARP